MHLCMWMSRFYADVVNACFVSFFLMGESLDLVGLGSNPLFAHTRWSLSGSDK